MPAACVLIPAYNPDPRLAELVDGLRAAGVSAIVVVDDGSAPAHRPVFVGLEGRCLVVRHAVNLGKGRALKTGLNAALLAFPDAPGVVTADADGQHAVEDVVRVARALEAEAPGVVLGCRTFGPEVPFRSRFGNTVTRAIFGALVGKRISDTQTGLRGLPRAVIPALLAVPGERYEYEMNVLLATKTERIAVSEVPIRTIYLDGNRSSHFNPFLDSMRIYFQLLRFGLSSLVGALVDYLVFGLVLAGGGTILAGLVAARLVASVVNFAVNRRLVFRSRARVVPALAKYYALVAVFGAIAYFSITALQARAGWHPLGAKALVEGLLFIASFAVQRDFVFHPPAAAAPEA